MPALIGRDVSRRFVLTNTVALNGGDAAILRAIQELLGGQFGDHCRIDAFDSQPVVAARYYPDLAFHGHLSLGAGLQRVRGRLKRLSHSAALLAAAEGGPGSPADRLLPRGLRERLSHFRRADAIISTGGTYLTERYSLWGRFLDFELAFRLRKPLVLYTQSVDGFAGDRRRFWLRRAFSRAELALLRDERSLRHVRGFCGNERGNWHVQPDVVFSMAKPEVLRHAETRLWPGHEPRVLVSVRAWSQFHGRSDERGRELYRRSVATLVRDCVRRHQARVTFVSTCQGIPEYWANDADEARLVWRLLDRDVRERCRVDASFHRPEQLVELASAADLVIATRLHMAILSLCAGTPVLPIAYEHKTHEAFSPLGQGHHVLDINSITPGVASAGLERFLAALPGERASLFRAVGTLREGALASVRLLDSALRTCPQPPLVVAARSAPNLRWPARPRAEAP